MAELTPIRWSVSGSSATVERLTRESGPDWYAVRDGRWCLSIGSVWHYEPQPSDRTEEWLSSHRFGSLADAVSAIGRAKEYRP